MTATRPLPARAGAAPSRTAPARPPRRPTERHLRPVAPAPARRRVRRLGALAAAVAVVCLFGVAGLHAVIVQDRVRLDQLQTEVREEQDRYQRLRLRVAELESPERVVAVAQERLGMVPPPDVVYLSPSGPAQGPPGAAAGASPGSSPAPPSPASRAGSRQGGHPAAPDGVGAWAAVKPYLAERP